MKELFTALAKAQSAYKPVKKSGRNTFYQNRPYPTLNDFVEASVDALSSNGLCIFQEIESKEDGTWLTTTLAHASGESKSSSFKLILTKQDMQGFGSASTYGRRYAYAAIAGLAPEDDDGNDASSVKGNKHVESKPAKPAYDDLGDDSWPNADDMPGDTSETGAEGEKPSPFPQKPITETKPNSWQKQGPSQPQLKRLFALKNKAKWSIEQLNKYLKENMNVVGEENLRRDQYKYLTDLMDQGKSYEQAKTMGSLF
jgi:hypothetical protein